MVILQLTLQLLTSFPAACAQGTDAASNTAPKGQVVGNYITVDADIFLSNSYHLFNVNMKQKVDITINFNFTTPPVQNYQIIIRIFLSSVKVVELPSNATYTYGFWGYPPIGTLTFNLPGNSSSGSIRLEGYITGSSILFRNAFNVPAPLNISSPVGYVSSFRLSLVPPPSSKILRVYSRFYPELSVEKTRLNGRDYLIVSKIYPGIPFLVLYEHELWTPVAVIILVTAIFALIALPYVIAFLRKRKVPSGTKFSSKFNVFLDRNRKFVKKVKRRLLRLNASKLLAVYAMFALFMVSLSLTVGPDPRLKVYVLSFTPTVTENVRYIIENKLGGDVITVFDEMSEFKTLANLGIFSAVVVADFYPPSQRILEEDIYPGLKNLPHHYDSIIVLEPYADKKLADDVQKRYMDRTIIVKDLDSMEKVLSKIPKRENLLGLKVDPSFYLKITAFLGVCSFVLVFLGLAFLSFALIEIGKKPGGMGLFEAVMCSVFVFSFTEVIYIVCGVLLGTPLGLHAGGTRVTAVGLLGFGGGSRPRMLAGFLGFLFGALISFKEGMKISRIGLAAFLVTMFFLVVDPLTNGLIFYEFILLYATPYAFETATTTMNYVKDFLSSFGVALGGWTSPTLLISTGIILYYVGAIPFFLFPRLRKNTATLLLFFCAFSAGSGGIRVSNMRPWGAFMSMLPGITASFVAVLAWYGINFVEGFIEKKLEKGGLV